VTLYWAASAVFSVLAALLMRFPPIRAYYGLKAVRPAAPIATPIPRPAASSSSSTTSAPAKPEIHINPNLSKFDNRRKKKL